MSKTLSVNEPLGTASISQGDDQIRALKLAVVDNMSENHIMTESSTGVYSGTSNGRHNRVDLYNRETGADFDTITSQDDYGTIYVYLTSYTTEAGTYEDHELYFGYAANSSTSPAELLRLTRSGYIDLDNGNLTNNTALTARNNADNANINIIQVDTNDNRLIPGDIVISGALTWDTDTTYGLGSIVRQDDATQGECIYISLSAGNSGNDPSDVDNQYGEEDASNPVWERLLKRRDLPESKNAGSGIVGAYGTVGSDASVISAGSDNWTVAKTATGRYKLNITDTGDWIVFVAPSEISSSNTVVANPVLLGGVFSNNTDGNIHLEGNGGSNYDGAWTFIAFRVA